MPTWTSIWNFVSDFVRVNVINPVKEIGIIDIIDILSLTFILYFYIVSFGIVAPESC